MNKFFPSEIKLLILILFYLFFRVRPVFAIDAPVLISPSNNATVTSSKLEWQAPSYPIYTQGSPYVVQIKNIPTFTSEDDRYKTNTYYTPTLSNGIWYWRVKAKNSDGIWSDWSNTWSFVLTDSIPTPSPTSTSAPTPTPTPASTSSPTPTSSSFTISSVPSQINSDQPFNVSINLASPSNPNTTFDLKGAFKKGNSANYFGFTKVAGNWIKNGSSYIDQYQATTDASGNWSGNIEVKPDPDDTGFSGSGDYIFKVGQYNSKDSNPSVSWSNETTIKINNTGNSVGSSPSQLSAKSLPSAVNPSTQSNLISSLKIQQVKSSKVASIAGVSKIATSTTSISTPSAIIKVADQKQKNPFVLIGIIFIIAGIGSLGHLIFRKKYGAIYHLFGK